MLDERLLTTSIPSELSMQLRHRNMAFVNYEQEVLWKIVQQSKWWLSMITTINMHRIVFNSVAIAHFFHHLKVEHCSHSYSLSLQKFAFRFKHFETLGKFNLYFRHRQFHTLFTSDIVGRRKDDDLGQVTKGFTSYWINHRDSLDSVTEHLEARHSFFVCRMNFYRVAANTKVSATERQVIAVILQTNKARQNASLVIVNANMKLKQVAPIFARVAHAIDTTDGRNYYRVSPSQKCGGCRVAQSIYFIVD